MPFCDMFANISGLEQDIVDLKTALQTAITPVHACQIWWTLVHKRRKLGPSFWPTQSQLFSDAHISGAKGRGPIKISQLVQDDQRLLMHTSQGVGLPPTIF